MTLNSKVSAFEKERELAISILASLNSNKDHDIKNLAQVTNVLVVRPKREINNRRKSIALKISKSLYNAHGIRIPGEMNRAEFHRELWDRFMWRSKHIDYTDPRATKIFRAYSKKLRERIPMIEYQRHTRDQQYHQTLARHQLKQFNAAMGFNGYKSLDELLENSGSKVLALSAAKKWSTFLERFKSWVFLKDEYSLDLTLKFLQDLLKFY